MSVIVLVEDNPRNARLAERLLKKAGHEVVVSPDGERGLMTVFNSKPDLVMVDLGLPDLDGQTVVAILRQQEYLSNVPIVLFTAYPEQTAEEMAQAYGCNGVITKPIDTRRFSEQVGEFLATRPK